ncbi:sushi domain-containing protein 3-like isoform X2 [Mixophyes fleayi]|uniref:sushi domain-containing protein 3-like isoform X2 n=1 Tax=Mixophyes fleayi TaxID=3061075 RepID=UPI003F4E1CC9
MDPALCLLALCCLIINSNSSTSADIGNKTLKGESPIAQNSSAPALCPVLSAPPCGYVHMSGGAGRELGSIALFHCQEGYQLLGRGELRCHRRGDALQWSHPQPQCKALPQTSHKGFRLAVVISLVTCFIVVTMFVSFTVCCIQEKQRRLLETSARWRENLQNATPEDARGWDDGQNSWKTVAP